MPMFLSPHFDDVALSCSGVLSEHRARGEAAVVVTVFAGGPPSDLPVRAMHRDVVRRDDVTHDLLREHHARRVAEDRAAMEILDAEVVHLAFGDAVFRSEIQRWADVWSEPTTASPDIRQAVIDAWRERGRPMVYAPLGVGRHVDHRLCFVAGRALAQEGAEVWHYEDHPYATRPGQLAARMAELGTGWHCRTVDVREHVERRREAVSRYESQLRGIPLPSTTEERLWCAP